MIPILFAHPDTKPAAGEMNYGFTRVATRGDFDLGQKVSLAYDSLGLGMDTGALLRETEIEGRGYESEFVKRMSQ